MNITINDRECMAKPGDRLLDAARANHAHIGYFCGGNALCQTCYVKVLEGAELLAPMTSAEKAMLSDNLISEGYRMGCQAIIEKPGTIRLLTTAEEAKLLTLENPAAIPAYMGKMGMESAVKFTDTIAFQSRRDAEGHQVSLWQLLSDVVGAIGGAMDLLLHEVRLAFGPKTATAAVPPATSESCGCASHDGGNGKTTSCCGSADVVKVTPEVLRIHPHHACASCN